MNLMNAGLALIGVLFLSWSLLIVLNSKFYRWWRDRYWKEANDGHLSRGALLYNRYIEGACTAAFGGALIYAALATDSLSGFGLSLNTDTVINFTRIFFGGLLFALGIWLIGNEGFYRRLKNLFGRQSRSESPVQIWSPQNYPRYIIGIIMVAIGLSLIYIWQ